MNRSDKAGWHRLSTCDRLWLGEPWLAAFGPVDVPGTDDLVAAVRAFAKYPATTRLGLTLDTERAAWRPVDDVDAWARDCVRVVDAAASNDDAVMAAVGAGRGAASVVLWVGGDRVCVAADHGLGDRHFLQTAAAVVEAAHTGLIPQWVSTAPHSSPLRAALWNQFGRRPENAMGLVRWLRARSSVPAQPPVDTASIDPPWSASPTVRTAMSGNGALDGLRRWRDRAAPGASSTALVIAAAHRALDEMSVPTTGAPVVLFSLRRYLPQTAPEVAGNFAFGIRVPEATSGNAVLLHQALQRDGELGRPLAAFGAAAARRARRGALQFAGSGAWDVAHSHLGRQTYFERLAWKPSDDVRFSALASPSGPTGVTLVYSETMGRLCVSASFHDSVVDTAVVDKVIDRICRDPLALLEGARA